MPESMLKNISQNFVVEKIGNEMIVSIKEKKEC